ncbi:MAG: hypothetical protein AAF703_11295 [Cyanobacteria bacterium P01_D01_bin.105]
MAKTYKETFWDCPECHEPNISGVFNPQGRRCPNCFYYRRDHDLLEVRDISKTITDAELQKAASVPDLVCGNPDCQAEFADEGLALHLIQCPRCESWMSDWTEKKVTDREFGKAIAQTQASPATRMENIAKVYGESAHSEADQIPRLKGSQKRSKTAKKLAIGGAVTIGLLGTAIVGVMLFDATPITLTVENKYFEVTTTVETYRPRSAADWAENVPTVAYRPGDTIDADQPIAYEVGSKRTESKLRSSRKVPISRLALSRLALLNRGHGLATLLPIGSAVKLAASSVEHSLLLTDCTVGGSGVAICEDDPAPTETSEPESLQEIPASSDESETEYRTEEVWDVWVAYTEWSWQPEKPKTFEGEGDVPNAIPEVSLSPMQREKQTELICYIEGTYLSDDQPETATTEVFEIDCNDSEQLRRGDQASLMMNGSYVWIEDEY